MIRVVKKIEKKYSILIQLFFWMFAVAQVIGCKEDVSLVSKKSFIPIKEPQLNWSVVDKMDSVLKIEIFLIDSGSRLIKKIDFEYFEDSLYTLNKKSIILNPIIDKPLEIDVVELRQTKKYWGRVVVITDIGINYFNPGELFFPLYPTNTIHCDASNPTIVKEVLNPTTGRIWMDRNLGANRVATSSNDALAYGDLYQWGRRADGHQCRNSATRNAPSIIDQPLHGDFITSVSDWRNPNNNNLWEGLKGINNPCPVGFRVPTWVELDNERNSWDNNNALGAYNSILKFTAAGRRNGVGGFEDVGKDGGYWTSSVIFVNNQNLSKRLAFNENVSFLDNYQRMFGFSVRCIKN